MAVATEGPGAVFPPTAISPEQPTQVLGQPDRSAIAVEGISPGHLEEGEEGEAPCNLGHVEGVVLPDRSALLGGDFPKCLAEEEEEEEAPDPLVAREKRPPFLCRGAELALRGMEAGEAEDSLTSLCCIYLLTLWCTVLLWLHVSSYIYLAYVYNF